MDKRKKSNDNNNIKKKKRRRIGLLIFVGFLVLVVIGGIWGYDVFIVRGRTEKSTRLTKTNTDPVLYTSERQLKRQLRYRFPNLAKRLEKTIVVPGMRATEALQSGFAVKTMCTSMTPQGMCVTEKYIFISAYCATHRHNSTLYMIDKKTGKLIKTIALGTRAHVGGVAYDPEHKIVWVSGGTKGTAKAIGYTLDSLVNYKINRRRPAEAEFNYTLATIERNSYMTYADHALYIGYFSPDGLSELERFNLTKEGGLKAQIFTDYDELHESVVADHSYVTGRRAQGAAKSNPYMLLSKSYGILDSTLLTFQMKAKGGQLKDGNADLKSCFPQKMEQICVSDGKLYCLFESAAYAYRAQPFLGMDRVLVFNVKNFLPKEQKRVVDIADIESD